MKKSTKLLKSAVQNGARAYKAGKEIYAEHQETRAQRAIDDERIRRFGSLAAANAHEEKMAKRVAYHRQLMEKASELKANSVRYPEVIGRNMDRVAIVTNFCGSDHDYIDPRQTAQATSEELAKRLGPAKTVVVEALAEAPQRHSLPNYRESAALLADALKEKVADPETEFVVAEYQSEFLCFTPEEVQQRIEHYEGQSEGEPVGYIAVTSALELDAFGAGVKSSVLGAYGDMYDDIVRGGILVPGGTEVNDAWQPIRRPDHTL